MFFSYCYCILWVFDLHCAEFDTRRLFSHSLTERAKFLRAAFCAVTERDSWQASFPKVLSKDRTYCAWQPRRQTNRPGQIHCTSQISFWRTKNLDLWSWEQALLILCMWPYCVGHSRREQSGTAGDKEKLQRWALYCLETRAVWQYENIFLSILFPRFQVDSSHSHVTFCTLFFIHVLSILLLFHYSIQSRIEIFENWI